VPKGKNPHMAALRLADDNKCVYNGTPQSSGSSGAVTILLMMEILIILLFPEGWCPSVSRQTCVALYR
jgi:hypothetical protein